MILTELKHGYGHMSGHIYLQQSVSSLFPRHIATLHQIHQPDRNWPDRDLVPYRLQSAVDCNFMNKEILWPTKTSFSKSYIEWICIYKKAFKMSLCFETAVGLFFILIKLSIVQTLGHVYQAYTQNKGEPKIVSQKHRTSL